MSPLERDWFESNAMGWDATEYSGVHCFPLRIKIFRARGKISTNMGKYEFEAAAVVPSPLGSNLIYLYL